MRPYRTLLFVPAHKPDWARKAVASGADAVVIDLEDSVPPAEKDRARHTARATIESLRADGVGCGLLVRPNALDTGRCGADLEAVVGPGLDAVFAPKIGGARDVLRWETLLEWFETRNGATDLELVVPVETVAAVVACEEIAGASPRVGAMIGPTSKHADIARAVGYRQTPQGLETLYLRSRVLLACRLHGLHALTGLWEDLADLEGLADFAGRGLDLGFRGQVVIHPSHVPVVNAAYTPTEAEVEHHEALVAAVEEAERQGLGAVRFRGEHVDIAHADQAREWLAHARAVRGRD